MGGRHDTNPGRFSANVDRAIRDRSNAAQAEQARQGRTVRVSSERTDRSQ